MRTGTERDEDRNREMGTGTERDEDKNREG